MCMCPKVKSKQLSPFDAELRIKYLYTYELQNVNCVILVIPYTS